MTSMADLLIHTVCIVIFPTICFYLYWESKIAKELTYELARECDVKFNGVKTLLDCRLSDAEDLKKEIEVLKKELADIVKDFRGDIEDHKKEIKLLKKDNEIFIEKYTKKVEKDLVNEVVKEFLSKIQVESTFLLP